ncbi:MAG: tetratricopeptide repeat protein [Terriglobia bacterium]
MSKRISAVLILTLAAGILASCHRDPNVRKHNYYAKAVRYFDRGKYQAAAIELRSALKIDPRYADAHYEMAQCDMKLGFTGDAYKELLTTVELAPGNSKAQVDLGDLFLAARDYPKAQTQASLVLSKEPKNADAHALLANTDAALERPDEALAEMNKAVQLEPTAVKYSNLALLESRAQDAVDAEKDYQKVVSLEPRAAWPHLQLGSFYAREHHLARAEQEFREAIALAPKAVAPQMALVGLYQAEGQASQAEAAAREAKQVLKHNPQGYRILGDYYLSTGQRQKALAEFASLHRDHAKDLTVANKYVQLLILDNNLEEASKIDAEIRKRAPHDVAAIIDRGRILNREGRSDHAILTLQSALKAEPDNPVLHYYLGAAFSLAGKLDLAEREWRETVRERPNAAGAQAALAAVEEQRRDFDGLETTASALVRLDPASPLGYCYLAVVDVARGNTPAAMAEAKKAIEVAPKHPLGYTRLGELLAGQKNFKGAEKNYEVALDNDPGFTEALRGLATDDLLEKQPAQAIARVEAQIAKVPNNGDYDVLLGELLTGQKDYAGAEAALEKAVGLSPRHSAVLFLLGEAQRAQGKRSQAIATFQRAVKENPGEPRSFVVLGALEEAEGNWQAARGDYQKALQAQPGYAAAANNLAYLMLQHGGNIDVALSLAQTARRAMPNSPGVADTLALAYYKKGDYSLAASLLAEALKKAPDSPDFNYHMGLVCERNRDKAEAIVHFERVLKLDPGYAKATRIRQSLVALQG